MREQRTSEAQPDTRHRAGETIRQFDRFYATFQPKRTDDLKDGVAEAIGERYLFEAYWVIEPEDNKEYADDWYCVAIDDPRRAPFVWAVSRDLADIELVDR